jgi:hypothetical protein
MNSEMVFYSFLALNLLFFIAILIWFNQRNRAGKVGYEQTTDVWAEASVWRSYERLIAHQQQLSEWQNLCDERRSNVSRAVAKMKQDVFPQNPMAAATTEVLQLSKDEKYLTDLAVLGFEYCLNWAIKDFEHECGNTVVRVMRIDVSEAGHKDLVFYFRLILDLARCTALKQNQMSMFISLRIAKKHARLQFKETGSKTVEPTNALQESIVFRIKSRLASRGIAVPLAFSEFQNFDIETDNMS